MTIHDWDIPGNQPDVTTEMSHRISELKAKLAQARTNNTKLRQVLKNILADITSDEVSSELRGQINRVLRETRGHR